jgi:transcriptional regulator with XRE-family HTH domain
MTAEHSSYEDLARERRSGEGYRQGYAEARRAFLIGQAVRERRVALGLSQVELATRAGMTQPALSRLEAGGVVPTITLLERISIALDADLIVEIAPHAALSGTQALPASCLQLGRRPCRETEHSKRLLPDVRACTRTGLSARRPPQRAHSL